MKIVQFNNGKYAMRRGNWLFGYLYKDLKNEPFWWSRGCSHFQDCLTDNLEELKSMSLNDYGKPI